MNLNKIASGTWNYANRKTIQIHVRKQIGRTHLMSVLCQTRQRSCPFVRQSVHPFAIFPPIDVDTFLPERASGEYKSAFIPIVRRMIESRRGKSLRNTTNETCKTRYVRACVRTDKLKNKHFQSVKLKNISNTCNLMFLQTNISNDKEVIGAQKPKLL